MDFIRNFPMFSVVLSLFSGVLCTMLSGKKARIYTIIYECILLVMVAAVLRYTVVTGEAFTYVLGEFPAPWGNELRAGTLEASIAVLFIAVMLCAILNLMTAALMAMTWTNDIFSGYVFLEILTLTSCGVLIVREIGRTTLAAVRYMILNLVGSGLFLLGVVLLYDITGNLLMVPMQREIAMLYQDPGARVVLIMATGILTIGLSIKSGLFPFHYWMPDTYGWATPTSGAVLSSLVSKCYIFLLIKIYWRVIGIDIFTDMPIRNVLFVLGLCGMVFGSVSGGEYKPDGGFLVCGTDRLHLYGDRTGRNRGLYRSGVPHHGPRGHQIPAVSDNAETCRGVRKQPAVQESAGLRPQRSQCGTVFPDPEPFDDRYPHFRRLFVKTLFCFGGRGQGRDQTDPGHAGAGGKFAAERIVLYKDTDPYLYTI